MGAAWWWKDGFLDGGLILLGTDACHAAAGFTTGGCGSVLERVEGAGYGGEEQQQLSKLAAPLLSIPPPLLFCMISCVAFGAKTELDPLS